MIFQLIPVVDGKQPKGYWVSLRDYPHIKISEIDQWLSQHDVSGEYYAVSNNDEVQVSLSLRIVFQNDGLVHAGKTLQDLCKHFGLKGYLHIESENCWTACDADGDLIGWMDLED